ncbi:MAG: hypothetical protein ACE5G2_03400 [Candidatus Krumholzibacteriia bacterium]
MRHRRGRRAGLVFLMALLSTACGDDPLKPTPDDVVRSPRAVVEALGAAYEQRGYPAFSNLLSLAPGAEFLFLLAEPSHSGETQWGPAEEARIHRRMFEPQNPQPGEPEVPVGLWLRSVDVALRQEADFEEREELYRSETNPDGLDPALWRAMGANYETRVEWTTSGPVDVFRLQGRSHFVVVENLAKRIGERGKFRLFRWEDLGSTNPDPFEASSWGAVKQLYRTRAALPADSEPALIEALEEVYRQLDDDNLWRILSVRYETRFEFVPSEPTPWGETRWGVSDELTIHRRMFRPQDVWAGEPGVPSGLHLQLVDIELAPETDFRERPDLYFDPETNPDGLDPGRWRATEATYGTFALFLTQAGAPLRVEGGARFVVIESLGEVTRGDRYRLFRWEDEPGSVRTTSSAAAPWWCCTDLTVEETTWTGVKLRYRPDPVAVPPIDSEEDLIDVLALAYRRMDPDLFESLLADQEQDGIEFLFFLLEPTPDGAFHWGHDEEARIHRRMFRPDGLEPGEPAVPSRLWLQSVTIDLAPLRAFEERTDLYRSEDNPDGLDPGAWRASGAPFWAEVSWHTQRGSRFGIHEMTYFVVVEDLAKAAGDPGRFRIYRWSDMGYAQSLHRVEVPAPWGTMKALWR